MPFLLALDVGALTLCFVLCAALALLVGAADIRRPVSRAFVIFALLECGWSVTSLLLRLSLWFATGNPLLMLVLASMFFAVMGPVLLLFAQRYLQVRSRWPLLVVLLVSLAQVANVPWLLGGKFLSHPLLRANGMVLYHFTALGRVVALIPAVCMALALVLFVTAPRRRRGLPIAISIGFVMAGYLLGGVLQIDAPVMSVTLTAGVGFLGWGIIRRQLLNPLRDLTIDLRERSHRQELVAQVSRRTTMLLGLDELLSEAATLIRDSFDYFTVTIFLVEGEQLVLRASTLPALAHTDPLVRLRVGVQGICGAVAASGAPIRVSDVSRDPRYVVLSSDVRTRSELAVPIQRSGRVIGVLDVQSAELAAFNDSDIVTQQTIADQLSIAIENARLYEETRRRAERLALVNRISSAAGAVLDLDELLATVYREVTPIFEADAFFIALYDAETNMLDFRIQVDEGVREPPVREPLGSRLTARVVTRRTPLLINDVAAQATEAEAWGTGKMPTSWMGVPMLIGERIVGVMSVQTYREHRYDEDDLLLAATIADQASIAVENARLYEAVRQELGVRQRTEQVLRESEEKFRNLAEQSPNMIFINKKGRVVYANRQCELTMGYTREEFYHPGFNFQEMTAPGYEGLLAENFRRHAKGEEVAPYEYTMLTRTGRRIDAILTPKLIRYGDEPAILGIITDITLRARTERLLESLNAAALAMEQALTPAEIFPAAARVLAALGYESAVFLCEDTHTMRAHCWSGGAPGDVHVEPPGGGRRIGLDDVTIVAEAVSSRATLFTTSEALGPLYRDAGIGDGGAAGSGGSEGVVVAPLAVGDELVGLLIVTGRDISHDDVEIYTAFAHQAAAAWRKTRLMRDLQGSIQELRQTQEQLLHAQKMEAVGRLAGGIAHDFNNLLTVISGYTSLLRDAVPDNAAALEDLEQIRTTIKRASTLTSRLLSFSRKQILQPTVMDLNSVVSASLGLLRPLIGEDVELSVRPAPTALAVRADHYQMEQILMNLAVNARDAMPGGGRLDVETAAVTLDAGGPVAVAAGGDFASRLPADLPHGSWVILRVQDNGVGMSEETRAHVFEPFFTTKEEGKGSGLGLSTVYGIVTQSGGKVFVESALGRGSVFTVCLPRLADGSAAARPEELPRKGPGGTGTVLLVEDEPDVRELARRILEKAGYQVVSAGSAREALLIAEGSTQLACVITDVVMPGGMSGVEMGERLSRSRPSLPVLYMSGYTDDTRFHGPDGEPRLPFLGKPFQPNELLEKVQELARRRAPGR